MTLDQEKQLVAAQEAFNELTELLDSFKASKKSELVKDLKFYKSIYGGVMTSSMNKMQLQLQSLRDKLNASFLPNKYPAGDLRIFNSHQFEMVDLYLDTRAKLPGNAEEVTWKDPKPRNKFMELMENTTRSKNILKPESNEIFVRQEHPFKKQIEELKLPVGEMHALEFVEEKFTSRTLESIPLHWVDTEEALQNMYSKLKRELMIAVDLEHHSFHSYHGLLCLMQVSTLEEDFLVDMIKLRSVLQDPKNFLNALFANPSILKIFHGAESDIAWLQRDFDVFIVNMFDSFHAARILLYPRLSLAYLLERCLGVELDKKYQLADWRERPLTEEMIQYARKDTHYLIHLYFLLKRDLSLAQFEEVLRRSNQQCLTLYKPEEVTPSSWTVVLERFNYRFDKHQTSLVKAIFYWRQDRAKALDVSPPAIMPNAWIPRLVNAKVKTISEVRACLRNMSDLLIAELPALLEILNRDPEEQQEAPTESATHIRFEKEEEEESEPVKKAKIEIERPKRVISFAAVKPVNSAASIFGNASSSQAKATISLSSVVQASLPVIDSSVFVTKEQEVQAAVQEQEQEVVEEVVEEVKVHGANRVIGDLSLNYTTSTSTEISNQLRGTQRTVLKAEKKESIDFTAIKENALSQEQSSPEIFNPYQTVIKNGKKEPFIKAKPVGDLGPRLSQNPESGNKMATFTKKKLQ